MSVTSRRARVVGALCAAVVASGGALACCAPFASSSQSTVARGKYYPSGDPYYDEFFVDLYLLQVRMAEAPKAAERARLALIQLLRLEPQASPEAIEQRLHEEALKLSRAGIHLRLDQISAGDRPETAITVIRSNARPKEDPAAALLAGVEASSTNLLRSVLSMKQETETLGRLDVMTIRLDASVDQAFGQAPFGKLSEVKNNLADAHKLLPLMRARAEEVRKSSEQLLAASSKAIDTDDGSIAAFGAASDEQQGAQQRPDASRKSANKPRASGKPTITPPAAAARANRIPTTGDGDEPSKPRANGKPAPAPRDFEP